MEILINGETVFIDEEDLHLFHKKTWRVYSGRSKKYLKWVTSIKGVQKIISYHRLVINAPEGKIVDHINGNGLDNRKCNLRLVNKNQNARNRIKTQNKKTTSRMKGVSFNKGLWHAQITINKKLHSLGRYKDEFHAAMIYDLASIKYHGEYGLTNFLPLA